MAWAIKHSGWLLLAATPLLFGGCGKSGDDPNAPQEEIQLKEIQKIYTLYMKKNEAPPKQFSDIDQPTYSEVYPGGFNGIKDGKYVVVWGVTDKGSGTVLAYAKDAPEKGGMVVMADGSVKTMTAGDLQAAIKK